MMNVVFVVVTALLMVLVIVLARRLPHVFVGELVLPAVIISVALL